jgi:hypothetical protein
MAKGNKPKSVKKWLGKELYYSAEGQMIFTKDHQLVADIRGWGALIHCFETLNEASDFQDEIGQFIVDAINEKLKSV